MKMEGGVTYNIRAERLAKSEAAIKAENEFRDSIATVDEQGKRIWIFPKQPSGKFHQWRIVVTVALLTIFFANPFIKIGGQPAFLFNIFERKFVVLGQAFWPQDFFLLALVLIIFFIFIIVFTVAFGRIWCGWMCPQTLFMEMVFRKIEYMIEGDASAQRRLANEPLSFNKVMKKTLKHVIFIVLSLLIAHTVMAYLIGAEQTFEIITHSPGENVAGFMGIMSFTAIIYGVYAKFREQACIAVCPYGRLQGVLLNKKSIVVAYDWLRGEPRGHIKRNVASVSPMGDCIDCKLCVHVCPTGIDIRNGTQMECVNCTACIDACDDVMIKIGKPTGLIRYASHHSITEGVTKLLSKRVIGYAVILLVLTTVLTLAIMGRSDVETTVLKVPGTLYQREAGYITNLYNVEFVNKTFEAVTLNLKVESAGGATLQKVDQQPVIVPGEGILKSVYFIKIPENEVVSARTVVQIGIYIGSEKIETINVKFVGPVTKRTSH